MLDFILNLLKQFGLYGLLSGLAFEASSLPFPGTLIALTYGYLLKPSIMNAILISLLASSVYTAFSYIPYVIGYRLEKTMKRKLSRKKIEKAQKYFNRWGQWSVSIARLIGIGNYISYAAGISKLGPYRFGILTYIGILPWILVMLLIGQAGSLGSIHKIMSNVQMYLIAGGVILVIIFLIYRFSKKRGSSPQQG